MEDRLPRKLAAILYADVAGYGRLTGEDEDETHRTLSKYLDLISNTIQSDRGQVMHYAGDAVLARFDAVVDALSTAVTIQHEINARNQEVPEERKVQFRIGVNLGDVIEDRGDIYGDGVNVAARLEGLADSGGICVSDAVRTAVGKKLGLVYEDLGEQEVKNIAEPVRAYRVRSSGGLDSSFQDDGELRVEDSTRPVHPLRGRPGTTEVAAAPEHDRPSLVVFPFGCMAEDRALEYLAEGLTQDITTLLARIPGFFVISRRSALVYKERHADTRQVAGELGVRYVVEGSMRPIEETIRVTVQLIDAEGDAHLWADHFDRPSDRLLEVQEEITQAIVARIEPELTRAELTRMRRRPPSSLDAWALYQRAHGLLSLRGWRAETFEDSIDLLRQAIALDQDFALAHAYLSLLLAISHMFHYAQDSRPLDEGAIEAAERAMDLDSDDSSVLGYVGCALCDIGHTRRGLELLEQAVEYDPSNAQAWTALGTGLMRARRVREGVEKLKHGIRISPMDSRLAYWGTVLANALFRLGDEEAALEEAHRACRRNDGFAHSRVVVAMILAHQGSREEAAAVMADAKRIFPELCSENARGFIGRRGVKVLQDAGLLD
jgi:adenylate cyclase